MENIPNDELIFLNENSSLRDYFYNILTEIKNNNKEQITNVSCKNSYERRIVHILAKSLGLYHARYVEWDNNSFNTFFDHQCGCKYCWKSAGENWCKIAGVKVANVPICLSKKDKTHQKQTDKKWAKVIHTEPFLKK